jgi:response regulator RpfG family c-di-GMP phosphodiesterase
VFKILKTQEADSMMRLSKRVAFQECPTSNHLRRMGDYAVIMGEALGWGSQQIEDIRVAAPLHDIGKIAIKNNILLKKDKLTKTEFKQIQQHTVVGCNMLMGGHSAVLGMAADIALMNHHEKWDGSGYPNGTAGINIPEVARIVTILDIYDALVHQQVYKSALTEEETVEYLQQIAEEYLDPNLLRIFLAQLPAIRAVRRKYSSDTPLEKRSERITDSENSCL